MTRLAFLAITDGERRAMGEKARHFVCESKNKVAQAKRIIEFLND